MLLLVDLGLAWGLGALWLDEDLDPKNVVAAAGGCRACR